MSSYLRPDEEASQSIIRRAEEREANIKRGLKTATGIGTTLATAYLGSPLASKIAPFLNEYIPADLAFKGINKISPKLGNFLQNGMKNGLDLKGGLDYLKEQFSSNEKPAKESRNIIEQESPELHQFILDKIKSGLNPLQAAAIATLDSSKGQNFKKIISKLQNTHKIGWGKIVEDIYGSGQTAQSEQQQQASVQQSGQGQAALMAILQKIQQARGGGQ